MSNITNVSKINNTTYDVTANGTYVFTFNDNANNQGTLSVSISSIEEKKLRIGDYVDMFQMVKVVFQLKKYQIEMMGLMKLFQLKI